MFQLIGVTPSTIERLFGKYCTVLFNHVDAVCHCPLETDSYGRGAVCLSTVVKFFNAAVLLLLETSFAFVYVYVDIG